MYTGSPFTLADCVCGASSVTQSFGFKSIKVGGKKGSTKNCLTVQGDYVSPKGPYYPKLVSQGEGSPFSGVYAAGSFDVCITFEPDQE